MSANDFSFEVDSLYYGTAMNVRVRYRGAGPNPVDKWCYVERRRVCDDRRIDYEWMKKERSAGRDEQNVFVAQFKKILAPKDVGARNPSSGVRGGSAPASARIRLIFFVDGGYIVKGEEKHREEKTMQNPLKALRVEPAQEGGGRKRLRCTVEVVPGALKRVYCTLGYSGLCVHRERVALSPTARTQTLYLAYPRINGKFDVDVRYDATEETKLMGTAVDIADASIVHLLMVSGRGYSSKALCAVPESSLTVRCAPWGSMRVAESSADALDVIQLVRRGDTESNTSLVDLQRAPKVPLTAQHRERGSLVVGVPSRPGLYDLVLGLHHESGVYLPGDTCLLLVSPLAEAIEDPNEACDDDFRGNPFDVAPPTRCSAMDTAGSPAAAFETTAAQGGGCVCCVCQDNAVNIKLDPCKHVVLCEECFQSITRTGQGCPICRTAVGGHEVVFVC